MKKKQYDARLQRRLQLLRKEVEAGKFYIADGLQAVDSLKKVRYNPDGTADLNTVDGFVRSMALAVEFVHDREELKQSISLAEIQTEYFAFIENQFGNIYKNMTDQGVTPHDMAITLSQDEAAKKEITTKLNAFLNVIDEFWANTADAAFAHVEDMDKSLKGVFGGDLFPSYSENIASKCGIYTDTIILPDPFLRTKHAFERGTPEQKVYYLIMHGLNLLQYKELACADVTPPVVVVLPDRTAILKEEKEFFYHLGQIDVLVHAAKMFGRSFGSFDELMDFASSLKTIDQVEAEITDQKKVLFNTEWGNDLRIQIQKALADKKIFSLLRTTNPGIIVASHAVGRMSTSNELLVKARRLRGTPIIEAPTSWQYFVWKLEYDAEKIEKESNLKDLHVLRGLQSVAENKMEWLGKVPPKALLELRKADALHEIRAILSKGVAELTLANPTDFHATSNQIFDNIHVAFLEHRKHIAELSSKKWKFAGTDIGSWLVVGSLAVTAAATGLPVWGLAAIAADQLLDAPKLRDIPKSIKDLAEENKTLKQSPVGMLFKYSDDNT
ncbi:MAG TPA: hypothetical protein P5077_09265 [bacterium]|nr:hypothetical protein [bacterium]